MGTFRPIVALLLLGVLSLAGCSALEELSDTLSESGIEVVIEEGRPDRLYGIVDASSVGGIGTHYVWEARADIELRRMPGGWRGSDDSTEEKSVYLTVQGSGENHQVDGSGDTMGTFVLKDNGDGTCTITFSHGSIPLQESERIGSKWIDFESNRGNRTYTIENIPMSLPERGFSGSETYESHDGMVENKLSWSFAPK